MTYMTLDEIQNQLLNTLKEKDELLVERKKLNQHLNYLRSQLQGNPRLDWTSRERYEHGKVQAQRQLIRVDKLLAENKNRRRRLSYEHDVLKRSQATNPVHQRQLAIKVNELREKYAAMQSVASEVLKDLDTLQTEMPSASTNDRESADP